MTATADDLNKLTAHLFREQAGKMTGVLARIFGLHQVDRIQDIVQETFETALHAWRFKGVPAAPEAWLMRVARNKALNAFRRDSRLRPLPAVLLAETDGSEEQVFDRVLLPGEVQDSTLRLLFVCVQLDFPVRNRVLLTLHLLCGFGVKELAGALLMQEETVKKALFRMKAELKQQRTLWDRAVPQLTAARAHVARLVLYLMFSEGYKTTRSRVVINHALCYEAMRLTTLLLDCSASADGETEALLALQFFALARFEARLDAAGAIVLLEEQDRSRWEARYVAQGNAHLREARNQQAAGRYYLEALISSLHCAAPTSAETDWCTIVFLYAQLEALHPTVHVRLNHLLARSRCEAPAAVLPALDALCAETGGQQHGLLTAARADVLARAGRNAEAREAFAQAAAQTALLPERALFLRRAASLAKG